MKKVWNKIVAWISKAAAWFKNLAAKNDEFVKKIAPVAIDVVNCIKKFNASAAADALVSLISLIDKKYGEKYATAVQNFITKHIDEILAALNISVTAASTTNVSEKIKLICNYIAGIKDEFSRGEVLTTLAAKVAAALDDNKLSFAEIVSLVEYVYSETDNDKK